MPNLDAEIEAKIMSLPQDERPGILVLKIHSANPRMLRKARDKFQFPDFIKRDLITGVVFVNDNMDTEVIGVKHSLLRRIKKRMRAKLK